MAQQIKFEPAFEPADNAINFEPAFEAAEPTNIPAKPPGGKWVTKGSYTEWQADKPVDVNKRPDNVMIGGVPGIFDRLRDTAVNRVSSNKYLPESVKPYAAMGASLSLEPLRFIAETLATPEGILFPSAVKGFPNVLKKKALTPEVLPPEIPKPNLALPPARNRYIASDNGLVQRENILTPQEEARLAGVEYTPEGYPAGKPTQITRPGVDLDELKEQERIKNIYYTGHEQAGGSSLNVRNRPIVDIPPVAGDKHLGFEPVSNADLEYPLNIAPEAVRPRRAQTVTRALAGDVPEEALPKEPITFENEVVKPQTKEQIIDNYGGTKAIEPGEDILPSAPPKARVAPHIQETEIPKATPFEKRVDNYVAKNVEPAIPNASAEARSVLSKTKDTMSNLANGLLVSGEKQLERMGSIGNDIRRVLSSVEYTKRELYNKFAEPFINATKGLKGEEVSNFVDVMDGNATPINLSVSNAVGEARKLTDLMATMAEESGVRIKTPNGKAVTFKGLKEYWPHRPVNPISHTNYIDELMNRNPKLSRSQAENLAKKFQNESEWFNSPQHSRMFGTFEYRKDLNAMIDHMADMADIIARAKHLGPGDIGNPESLISQMIERTGNKAKALEIVRTQLRGGMDKNDKFYQAVKSVNSVMTKAQVFTKLGMFPISNINNQLQTMLHSDLSNFSNGVTEILFNSSELRKLAKNYGTVAVGDIPVGILSEAGKRPVPVVGSLIKWSDDWARLVATGTGKGYATTIFKAAKIGERPALDKLKNLLLQDNIGDVLQQNELTPEQIKFATHRFVELSQQLESRMKLPPVWSNEPLLQLPLLFKRFAFQGTKSTKDAILSNPARNLPLFLIAAPLFGELTGDMKAVVYGSLRGLPDPDTTASMIRGELDKRGNFAGKLTGLESDDSDLNWLVNRIAADYVGSWGMGLMGDVLQGALGGKSSVTGFLIGPAIDQATEVIGDIGSGNWKGLGREGLRSIPVIGPGVQRRILPTQGQEIN